MTERAGTVFHAPQARLIDVSSGRIIGSNQRAAGDEPTLTADLVSITAKVYATITTVGELTVVLNNQRFSRAAPAAMPMVPAWKYNDISVHATGNRDSAGTFNLTFGQRIRLDLRYGGGRWNKILIGRVTKLDFAFFEEDKPQQLTVTAEDILSLLKRRPSRDIKYGAQPGSEARREEAIIEHLIGANAAALGITWRQRDEAETSERSLPARSEDMPAKTLSTDKTYHHFLGEMVRRLDAEVFVQFNQRTVSADATLDPIALTNEVVIRVEPTRSWITPTTRDDDWNGDDRGYRSYLELTWGKNLVRFKPTFSVWETPTRWHLSGSPTGVARTRIQAELTSTQLQALINAELHPSPTYEGVVPINAIRARDEYFGNDVGEVATFQATDGIGSERAAIQARANALDKLRGFMSIEATVIGLPKLQPGRHVHVVGLRPPFDGFYYVTSVEHVLGDAGYLTKLTARRPGMLPPSEYLPAGQRVPPPTVPGTPPATTGASTP